MRHLQIYEMIDRVHRAGSIRKAAEDMNITASALNRRIQAFEQEFGSQIFERLPRGMRLNPAGELLVHHIRLQRTDMARLLSQVADLSGVRHGHVTIACSQALLPYFLPREIARYREAHPGVTFAVNVRDRIQAEQDLANFESDLALVFEPAYLVDFETIFAVTQPVMAVMNKSHPLARKAELRLRNCIAYDLILPGAQFGVRTLLERAARKIGRQLEPVVETESFEMIRHYALFGQAIGFQIPIGLNTESRPDMATVELAQRDVPGGELVLGQMRGRNLPVASLRFAQQLTETLQKNFG